MFRIIAPALFLSLVALGPASAQSVNIDFDPKTAFGELGTYSWQSTPETSLERRSPLMHQRVVKAVENQLVRSGVREVDSNPDVLVTYHVSTKEKLRVDTHDWDYGYPRRWNRWDYGMSYEHETTVTSFTEGTLIVDVWNPKTKQLIWRATATGTVSSSPAKAAKGIDRAVEKMGKKWEKMKKKGKVRLAR